MLCLRARRNCIKTRQHLNGERSDGLAGQAPSVIHTTHGRVYFHMKIILGRLLSVVKLFTNKQAKKKPLWSRVENSDGFYTFLIIFYCFARGKD